MIRREINWYLNGLTTSLTDACLLKTDYLHSLERKPEFSVNSIDDCINTLQIISGHMSHLISLESIELCCWLVEETWIMALYRCQFFSAMSKCLGLLTLRRMTDWGTPISNHENACWNVYACFFDRLVLQGVTRDRNNCTLNKNYGNACWHVYACFLVFFLQLDLRGVILDHNNYKKKLWECMLKRKCIHFFFLQTRPSRSDTCS